jgi:hypothetical protein
MKHFSPLLTWSSFLLACASTVNAGSFARAEPIKPDAVTNRKLAVPTDAATVDAYLIDMARSAEVNMMLDATSIPASFSVNPYPSTPGAVAGVNGRDRDKWAPFLINVMGDFAAQMKLSTLRPNSNTFLFWSEPDPRQLLELQKTVTEADERARFAASVAAGKAAGLPDEDIISGPVSDERLRTLLQAYLKSAHGWTGSAAQRNQNVEFRARWADLPLDLQALLLHDLRQQFVSGADLQLSEDEFWRKDEVRVRADKDEDPVSLEVQFRVTDEDGARSTLHGYPLTRISGNDPLTPLDDGVLPVTNLDLPAIADGGTGSISDIYGGISDDDSNPLLDADPALVAPVSLELKHVGLGSVLKELQKQSGVHLTAAENALSDKSLTARVDKMPVGKFMTLLTRMYGVVWKKDEQEGYVMSSNGRGELHLQLLRIGDPARYRQRYLFYNRADREQEKLAVGRAVVKQVGIAPIQSAEGVAVSSLPSALQKQLKYVTEEPIVEYLGPRLFQFNRMLGSQEAQQGLALRFGYSPNRHYRTPFMDMGSPPNASELYFSVQSDDGTISWPVFSSIKFYIAKPGERQTPGRRR